MDRLKNFIKDIRGMEIVYWGVFLLNLFSFILNAATGSLMILAGLAGMVIMGIVLYRYYAAGREG